MSNKKTILALSSILLLFAFPAGFFVLWILFALNFIIKNLYAARNPDDNLSREYYDDYNNESREASPTEMTYDYFRRYRESTSGARNSGKPGTQIPGKPVNLNGIHERDRLTDYEKSTFDEIAQDLRRSEFE